MKFYLFILVSISIVIGGCKPDKLEVEVYTSDVESASEGEVVEVPIKARNVVTFSSSNVLKSKFK